MPKLFANNGDPDQMPHSVASDLGLHCLPVTLLRVSRLQWVKKQLNKSKFRPKEKSVWNKMFEILGHLPYMCFTRDQTKNPYVYQLKLI